MTLRKHGKVLKARSEKTVGGNSLFWFETYKVVVSFIILKINPKQAKKRVIALLSGRISFRTEN